MTNPTPTPQAAAPTSGGGRRAVGIAVFGLLVLAVGFAVWVVFKPQWRMWCHGADRTEFQSKLIAEQDPAIFDVIEDVLRESDQPDSVRIALADVLIRKNRLSLVERALKDPRLDLRVVALRALSRQGYFHAQYVDDESWGVRATLSEWLADARAPNRSAAFQILAVVYPTRATVPQALLDQVRALVAPPPGGASQAAVRAGAAGILAGWGDCASAADLLALARREEEAYPKMNAIQAVARLYETGEGRCKEGLPEAAVREVVERGLAHPGEGDVNRAVRMAAMQVLARHPSWAEGSAATLRRILASGAHSAERRTAMDALVAVKDDTTIATFPRWFFDRAADIRSSAASAARAKGGPLDTSASESCLVGLVRDEPADGSMAAFTYTLLELRVRAGSWYGFPEPWRRKGPSPAEVGPVVKALFETGSYEGVTRAQVADAWLRWLVERRGFRGAEADAALQALAAFWAKARAGDVAGAKRVFEQESPKSADLWAYERGWLLSRGAD